MPQFNKQQWCENKRRELLLFHCLQYYKTYLQSNNLPKYFYWHCHLYCDQALCCFLSFLSKYQLIYLSRLWEVSKEFKICKVFGPRDFGKGYFQGQYCQNCRMLKLKFLNWNTCNSIMFLKQTLEITWYLKGNRSKC